MKHNNLSEHEPAIKLVEDFKLLYQTLNRYNLKDSQITKIYGDDVEFKDCFHNVKGINAFIKYLESVYENVVYSSFEFNQQMVSSDQAMLSWTMKYAHSMLNGGDEISVHGVSHIRYSEKIFYHHDYIDGGELLYEHIPVLGWMIKKLKKRMT